MVKSGKHGGMIMDVAKIRVGTLRNSKFRMNGAVVTLISLTTKRTFDELLSNIIPVPVYPFA